MPGRIRDADIAAVRERARIEGTSGLRRQERKAVELARQGRLGTLQRARWAAIRDELAARGDDRAAAQFNRRELVGTGTPALLSE